MVATALSKMLPRAGVDGGIESDVRKVVGQCNDVFPPSKEEGKRDSLKSASVGSVGLKIFRLSS